MECEGLTDCPIKIAPAEKDAERKANTQASGGTNPKRGVREVSAAAWMHLGLIKSWAI